MAKLRIKLVKSTIGRKPKHRATIQALGLRKLNQVVEKEDNPQMRGMIHQVGYLLQVEEI
jgi:large subunit ribosomal protein L30